MTKDILIIGESCRDVFVYCDTFRLCPDVPVPVLNIVNEVQNPGMARNVYENIISKVKECDIVTNYNWSDITKTRYVHNTTNHMFFRVDSTNKVNRINLSEISYDYKIIVISDYNKGFLEQEDINLICKKHPNVFLDTKKKLGLWAKNAKYIKINHHEYQNSSPINKILIPKIIHTTGGDGCEFQSKQFSTQRVDVKDSSGAGDTFIAGLVIKYLKTNNIEKSIKYANICASEVVKHRGVTIL